MLFQKSREVGARKLRDLVRVENLRLRDPERFPQRLQTESAVQCRRKLPGDDITAVPIQDRYEINESMGETDISYIGRPRLIRPIDRNFFQKVQNGRLVNCSSINRMRPRLKTFSPRD